jgi:hypothetical protein
VLVVVVVSLRMLGRRLPINLQSIQPFARSAAGHCRRKTVL